MGESIIDQLLQVTAARHESGFAGTDRGRASDAEFDRHLRKVGAATRTDAKPQISHEPSVAKDVERQESIEVTTRPTIENAPSKPNDSQVDAQGNVQTESSDEKQSDNDPLQDASGDASYDAAVLAAAATEATPSTQPLKVGDEIDGVTTDKVAQIATVVAELPADQESKQQASKNTQVVAGSVKAAEVVELSTTQPHDQLKIASGYEKVQSNSDVNSSHPTTDATVQSTPPIDVLESENVNTDDAATAAEPRTAAVAAKELNQNSAKSPNGRHLQQTPSADITAAQVGKVPPPAKNGDAESNGEHVNGRLQEAETAIEAVAANVQRLTVSDPQAVVAPPGAPDTAPSREPVSEPVERSDKSDASRTDGLLNSLTRLQRSAVAGADRGSESNTPRVDPARFVSRIAKAFHAAQDRQGPLQLRLSPPELGALRLELSIKDGALTAALETESATAKKVLLEHLPALRDRLAEQNIRIERFDVDVRRDGSGGQNAATFDQRQQQQETDNLRSNRSLNRQAATALRRTDEPQTVHIAQSPAAGLNLLV